MVMKWLVPLLFLTGCGTPKAWVQVEKAPVRVIYTAPSISPETVTKLVELVRPVTYRSSEFNEKTAVGFVAATKVERNVQ
jgi:hypothetical protein